MQTLVLASRAEVHDILKINDTLKTVILQSLSVKIDRRYTVFILIEKKGFVKEYVTS